MPTARTGAESGTRASLAPSDAMPAGPARVGCSHDTAGRPHAPHLALSAPDRVHAPCSAAAATFSAPCGTRPIGREQRAAGAPRLPGVAAWAGPAGRRIPGRARRVARSLEKICCLLLSTAARALNSTSASSGKLCRSEMRDPPAACGARATARLLWVLSLPRRGRPDAFARSASSPTRD